MPNKITRIKLLWPKIKNLPGLNFYDKIKIIWYVIIDKTNIVDKN